MKAFDPISVDYVDIVDDWVVDTPALFSGPVEQLNWMEINQSVSRIAPREPNEDEFESFIEGTPTCIAFFRLYLQVNDKSLISDVLNFLPGVDDEMIQGAAQGIQEDGDDSACG